jgi:tripartite-type tricarboxylate transporter receptor subunit TctC
MTVDNFGSIRDDGGRMPMVVPSLDRRSLLAAMLIGVGLASIDQASAEVAPALKVVFGFGRGSSSARVLSLLEGGLTRELGGPLEKIHMIGDQGRRATAMVAAVADPHDPVILVILDFESVVMSIVYADVPERPDLRPIAKLSRGISFALVVPSISEWQSWPALTSAQHQKPVRVATTGPRGGTGLFATILAKLGGFPIEMVTVNSTLAVALEALDQRVDAAVVNTYDIKLMNMMSNNALVPIITSGAARSPDFPDTPTISEITGDRTLDFTTSVSAFASRAMDDALAERLTRAFLAAGKASEAIMAATQMNFPLQVDGPEVVEGTLARNRRVGMRYREILERTP